MSSPFGSFDSTTFFMVRGVDLTSLGAAYLVFLATCSLTAGAFFLRHAASS